MGSDNRSKSGQWLWFIGLWLVGVATVVLVASLLHLLIDLAR
jgi:hypothetical protein